MLRVDQKKSVISTICSSKKLKIQQIFRVIFMLQLFGNHKSKKLELEENVSNEDLPFSQFFSENFLIFLLTDLLVVPYN